MISTSAFARCVVVRARSLRRFLPVHSRSTSNKLIHVLICLPARPYLLHTESRSSRSRKNWSSFFEPFQAENSSPLVHLVTFVGSLCGKTDIGKPKFIATAVPILASVMYTLVVAQLGYRLTPLPSKSSPTSRLLLRSNCKLELPSSKRLLYFYLNYIL